VLRVFRALSLEGELPIGICNCARQLNATSRTANVPNALYILFSLNPFTGRAERW